MTDGNTQVEEPDEPTEYHGVDTPGEVQDEDVPGYGERAEDLDE